MQGLNLDIVFIVDVTGSMGHFIKEAKKFLVSSMATFSKMSNVSLKYSLIVYRDHPPQDRSFASKILANNENDLKKALESKFFNPDGGGDAPESGLDAIDDMLNINFRPDALRYAFLVGDAALHGTNGKACACGRTHITVRKTLEATNIELYGVPLTDHATASFGTVCKEVVSPKGNTVATITKTLESIMNDLQWAVDKLFPALKNDPFKETAQLADELAVPAKQISHGIEILNTLQMTQEFV